MIDNGNKDIVYFELNNWFCGRNYPCEEPFIKWVSEIDGLLHNEDWVKENKLCVVIGFVDMSINYCVAATREWVENNCPRLLTNFKQFIREPDGYGEVNPNFHYFLPYEKENIGITYSDEEW